MPDHQLPSPKTVRDLFAVLLHRHVEVRPCPPFAPGAQGPGAIAVYIDDRVRTSAVITADLTLAAYAGAAIGLESVREARADVAEGVLSERLRENLAEIFNVAGSLWNVDGAPHVRLHQVHAPGDLPPAEISSAARVLGRRLDLWLDLAGYGRGRLGFVLPEVASASGAGSARLNARTREHRTPASSPAI